MTGRVCDTHVHVFDAERFPYATPRRFTPGYAGVDLLRQHLCRIGAGRVVLVQPSVYGQDHRCLLDALASLGSAGRGVAVLGPQTDGTQVAALDAAGVRGARINLVVDGASDAGRAREAIARVSAQAPPHWHIQLHVDLPVIGALEALLLASPRRFVLDHLGLPDGPSALGSAGWRALCRLAGTGKVAVKLSAAYLCAAGDGAALQPLVASLARANPHAIVWGSNWPHTQGTARAAGADAGDTEPFREVDDRVWLAQCSEWLAAPGLPASVLDDNAEALYGF
ncbi:amidohydrolase family protein [Xylophilus sp.]|uniref:amidohydrolase family protein n=1 Tax=Xylophilus sp. TaxID=2653893 RepID=UPI0013BBB8AC|nr:amidohydrolase family protein [Xylophilus sp.]KAF1050275.1 MAG: 2-pyrone-4,6-dicarbaxylate hydrolase [Xylophilus sp.]